MRTHCNISEEEAAAAEEEQQQQQQQQIYYVYDVLVRKLICEVLFVTHFGTCLHPVSHIAKLHQ
jgi:hypothetical protein